MQKLIKLTEVSKKNPNHTFLHLLLHLYFLTFVHSKDIDYNMKASILLMILACALSYDSYASNLRLEMDPLYAPIEGGNLWEFSSVSHHALFLVEMIYNDYKIIVNGVVVIIGLFLCFLGKKTVKVRVLNLTNYSSTCLCVVWLLEVFLPLWLLQIC